MLNLLIPTDAESSDSWMLSSTAMSTNVKMSVNDAHTEVMVAEMNLNIRYSPGYGTMLCHSIWNKGRYSLLRGGVSLLLVLWVISTTTIPNYYFSLNTCISIILSICIYNILLVMLIFFL